VIPIQRSRLGISHTHPVRDVETKMERHAHQGQHRGTLTRTEKQQQRHGRGVVEGARCSMLRRVRLVIEAHGGDRIQASVAHQEP
jgi:hypothetical protein